MKYPFEYLKVKHGNFTSLEDLIEELKRKKRGEILHLILSFVKTWEDFEKTSCLVKKALFILEEKPCSWNLEEDFIKPVRALTEFPQVKLFFPSLSEKVEFLLRERFIFFKGSTLRPDRIVIYPDKAVVVDFKTHWFEGQEHILEEYRNQVKTYAEAVFQIFNKPCYGFLLFIEKPKIEEVCFYAR